MALKLEHISHTEQFPEAAYIVAEDGPQGENSTYGECWGEQAKFAARAIHGAETLSQAKAKAHNGSVIICVDSNREVWRGKKF